MPLTSKQFTNSKRFQAAAKNSPVMKRGQSGGAIALLQASLVRAGFDMPISTKGGSTYPDGIFGKETDDAVERFQAAHALAIDGIVGKQTLERLDKLQLAFEAATLGHRHGWHTPKTYKGTVPQSTRYAILQPGRKGQ